ncbi:hypothetical protein K458DRAFT_194620 [Lentithecium fluviatile CBS 122367]|uniref:Uncharacterized protein n=1 Tax=Lentithecium fluviatile CBS 122367 TaxID=1168545 RepID=A0A6G1IDB0_9PLEO|nr:hypothetical protein K458DRAFT_194620 [Lentithecium fluviatile CBS 122367]
MTGDIVVCVVFLLRRAVQIELEGIPESLNAQNTYPTLPFYHSNPGPRLVRVFARKLHITNYFGDFSMFWGVSVRVCGRNVLAGRSCQEALEVAFVSGRGRRPPRPLEGLIARRVYRWRNDKKKNPSRTLLFCFHVRTNVEVPF